MNYALSIAAGSLIAIALAGGSCTAAVVASDLLVSPVAITGLVEGAPLSNETVATFVDLNAPGNVSDYTALIHWGDGTASGGMVFFESPGSFAVDGSHVYKDEGSYSYSTDVTYLPGGFVAVGIADTTTVADAALDLISTAAAGTFAPNVALNNLILATFRDENPFGSVGDFTDTVDWGDGTLSSGTLLDENGVFLVEGSHTYQEAGSFPVMIGIQDDGGSALHTQTVESSVAVVSEPMSVALIGLGLGAVLLARRKTIGIPQVS